jgi:hypothetical protein
LAIFRHSLKITAHFNADILSDIVRDVLGGVSVAAASDGKMGGHMNILNGSLNYGTK